MMLPGALADAGILVSCVLIMFIPALLSWRSNSRYKSRDAEGIVSYVTRGMRGIRAAKSKVRHQIRAAETRLLHGIQVQRSL